MSEPTATPPTVQTEPPWKLGDLGLFLVFALVTLFFANAVAMGLFALFRSSLGGNLRIEELLTATPFVISMQVIWESLWLVFIYYIVAVKYRRGFWQAIRWEPSPPGPKRYLFGGIVLAVVAQGVFSFFPSKENLPIERLFSSTTSGYLLALFGICVAPFMEELVFRGFFYPVFERMWGFTVAVAFTALLFALIHAPQLSGGWSEMAAIYCVGVVLSYARGKTGSLLPSYLMHLGYNATLFVSLYLTTDQFRTLQR
jgi:membrane protease YdiL (CAAX protease family)